MNHEIRIKRVYDPAEAADGARLLVDRLWPRGIKKERAALSRWAKEVAPSPELRKWFCHKAELYPEFTQRYRFELDTSDAAAAFAAECRKLLEDGNVTLVYAAKDTEHSHALVLMDWLKENLPD